MKSNNDGVFFLQPNDMITLTETKHIIEVQHMEKYNNKSRIKKLNKFEYMDLETGEIKEFDLSETRADNHNSLRQTFKKQRYLINNNFEGKPNELHVILTYAENMTDTKRLYKDFDKFMKRLRYEYRHETTIDYINVIEPQSRGAWHCHVLMRFNDLDTVFIENAKMRALWGLGFVTVKSLEQVDNIGAYLSAYLSDIEVEEDETGIKNVTDVQNALLSGANEIKSVFVEGKEKRFIKGGRLHMYPVGTNLFRRSKGIVKPERLKMRYKDIKKIVGSAKPHYTKSYKVDSKDFQNTITFIQYNLKR